jgi:methanesulfonate monooxygenase subunit beta
MNAVAEAAPKVADYVPPEILQPIQALIYRSALLMNEEAWKDYLGLCDPSYQYRVVNYSPEIRREQVWADRDFKGMKAAFDLMPRHNTDRSKLTRQVHVYIVDYDSQAQEAAVVSALTVYRTQMDGMSSYIESGQTSLYAIGLYRDRVRIVNGLPKLVERVVQLDTRQLDIGTHKPF